jgi:serine/threonine protein kinase
MIGRFKVVRIVGEGGMGEVYQALDTNLKRPVAIKTMKLKPRIKRTLQEEISALSRLIHPNIVTLYEVVEMDDGFVCAVMEFVDSGDGETKTLYDMIQQTTEHSTSKPGMRSDSREIKAARLLLPIAQALAYAHEKGVVHRDIKPQNILVKHSGNSKSQLVLSDWGIAKLGQDGAFSRFTFGIGTKHYRAPEAADSKNENQIDYRCDFYSFGLTLLLTAVGDFSDPGIGSKTQNNLEPGFLGLCQRCLEPNPCNRPQSMKGIIGDLERIIRREPVKIRPVTNLVRMTNFLYEHRHISFAVLFLLVLGCWISSGTINTESAQESLATVKLIQEHRDQSSAALEAGDFMEAESNLKQVLISDSSSAKDHAAMCQILLRQRRFDDALIESKKAVEKNPNTTNRLVLSECLSYSGEWEEALKVLDKLCEESPRGVEQVLARSDVNGFMERWPDCKRDFQKLLRVLPNRNHSRFGIAMACASMGDTEGQIAITRQMLDANMKAVKPRNFLSVGLAYGLCKEMPIDDHREMLKEFVTVWPYTREYFGNLIRGMLHYRLGDIEAAIPFLETAVKFQEKGGTPIELCFLAMCHHKQGKTESSEKALNDALVSLERVTGKYERPLTFLDPTKFETGTPTCWHQVARYHVCIAEAQALLAAKKQ